jgi:hypothetical protein
MSLRLSHRENADLLLRLPGSQEANSTVDLRVQCVVSANSDIRSWKKHRSVLTHDDIACSYYLSSESLHTQSLGIAVAAVPRAAASFLMCQRISPPEKQSQLRNRLL